MFECIRRKTKKIEQKQEDHGCAKTQVITQDISKAEKISRQYTQLKNCRSLLSRIEIENDLYMISVYSGGWRINKYIVKEAGIDINEVYSYIKKLAVKRKTELECELEKLNA